MGRACGNRKRKVQLPCQRCKKDCRSENLVCEMCNSSYHVGCEDVENDYKHWQSLSEGYVCKVCRSEGDMETFDYFMGIQRLTQASSKRNGYQHLQSAVRRELLLTPERECNTTPVNTYNGQQIDRISQEILTRYCPDVDGLPLVTRGDGDCLFNAASIALQGNDASSTKLRYLCCLEMLSNKSAYDNSEMCDTIKFMSPDYAHACVDCSVIGQFSSYWTIMALAKVIRTPIKVVYPPINGVSDLAVQTFNTTLGECDKPHITIMWTSVTSPRRPKGQTWTPNHFVPIVDNRKYASKTPIQSYATVTNKCYFQIPETTSPSRPSFPHAEDFDRNRYENVSDISDVSTFSTECEVEPPSKRQRAADDSNSSSLPFCIRNRNTSRKRITSTSSPKRQRCPSRDRVSFTTRNPYEPLTDDSSSSLDETEKTKTVKNDDTLVDLPKPGRFLKPEEILSAIREEKQRPEHVPRGPKSNVYVVLDNSHNTGKRERKERADYVDDCGVWDGKKGNTVNQIFVQEQQSLKGVTLRNGAYCINKIVKGTQTWEPKYPQPNESDLIVFHRYYATLKSDPKYKKKITTFLSLPSGVSNSINCAVVEYLGQIQISSQVHGNSKSSKSDPNTYERTRPNVLQKASVAAQTKNPRDVVYQMSLDDSVDGAPKSAKQVRDKKYRDSKKEDTNARPKNVADELLGVIAMLQTNEHVQEIIHQKNKPPCVILYSESQIEDMKTNCSGEMGSIIGIDRTFNLGACYVTPTSYKNRKVVRRETKDNPIMLGPMFLHWDGDADVYDIFMSHLRRKLGDGEFIFGTDEERALRKAIQNCFPKSTQLLCTKHLKDNLRRFLQDKVGCSMKDREGIITSIFGKEGIINTSDDSFSYDYKINLMQLYFEKYPRFQLHFQSKLRDLLWTYVIEPIVLGKISSQWTNNNSESINNRLKQSVNWKAQRLPELIEKLTEVSKMQMHDLRRALHGTGNFQLTHDFTKFKIKPEAWLAKTKQEKMKYFKRFISDKRTFNDKLLNATSMNFAIPLVSRVAKKPNQRKRPRAERTNSRQ